MKPITQEVFKDALPEVKSAAMDWRGVVWLFECAKNNLTPNHRSWVCGIETAFYFHSLFNDSTNWQSSAIDRELPKLSSRDANGQSDVTLAKLVKAARDLRKSNDDFTASGDMGEIHYADAVHESVDLLIDALNNYEKGVVND
ncbi:hypothetical protein FQ082_01945 [Psychrobacter sp. ANT_H56B]|uniref:hypothetical protein n=1 Tax=Psychrobacter sp. ANT_H56B TaxID=2597353 RepID=UPI0011F2067D|nr:hypothetical protein [Psychrobacter sp. ANT_H56B]KAA0929507.1 hypothetical protein FQ082_01945 [Psychrobacter sp. ANT_H56B]